MTEVRDEDIRAIVAATLAEQQRLQRKEIDPLVLKAITTTLSSFGIEEDRSAMRADFQHLRRWRKGVEQALGSPKAAILHAARSPGLAGHVVSAKTRQ